VENQTLSNVLAQANSRLLRTDEVSELLKLRAQVGQLREATKAFSSLEQENKQLREALAARQSPSAPFDRDTQSNRLSFIYVSGEVQFPNRLIWTNGMNLTAALEAVHGFTPYADRSALRLTRENGESLTLSFTDPIAINAAKPVTRSLFLVQVMHPRLTSSTRKHLSGSILARLISRPAIS
jgi:protein involved in polysaccharide export with SLBB domain